MDNEVPLTSAPSTVTTLSSLSHTDLRALLAAIKSVPEFKPDPSTLMKITDHTVPRSAVQAFTRAKKKLDDVTSFTFDNGEIASSTRKRLPKPKKALENGEVAPTKRRNKTKKASDVAEPDAKRVRVRKRLTKDAADEAESTEELAKAEAPNTAAPTPVSTQEHAAMALEAVTQSSSGELTPVGESEEGGLSAGSGSEAEDVKDSSIAGELGSGDDEEG